LPAIPAETTVDERAEGEQQRHGEEPEPHGEEGRIEEVGHDVGQTYRVDATSPSADASRAWWTGRELTWWWRP